MASFWEVLEKFENGGFSGLGFVFSQGDGIAGIDLDHCFKDGKPNGNGLMKGDTSGDDTIPL